MFLPFRFLFIQYLPDFSILGDRIFRAGQLFHRESEAPKVKILVVNQGAKILLKVYFLLNFFLRLRVEVRPRFNPDFKTCKRGGDQIIHAGSMYNQEFG